MEISSGYGMSNWHDDLKAAIRSAGEKAKNTVFLFTDSQILDETMVRGASEEPVEPLALERASGWLCAC